MIDLSSDERPQVFSTEELHRLLADASEVERSERLLSTIESLPRYLGARLRRLSGSDAVLADQRRRAKAQKENR